MHVSWRIENPARTQGQTERHCIAKGQTGLHGIAQNGGRITIVLQTGKKGITWYCAKRGSYYNCITNRKRPYCASFGAYYTKFWGDYTETAQNEAESNSNPKNNTETCTDEEKKTNTKMRTGKKHGGTQ